MNHRSGIPSFTKDGTFFEYRTEHKSREDMLKSLPIMKATLSLIVVMNIATRTTSYYLKFWKRYMNCPMKIFYNKISKPLELTNTYSGGKIRINNNEPYSYSRSDKWTEFPETNLSIALGSGSIVSNLVTSTSLWRRF